MGRQNIHIQNTYREFPFLFQQRMDIIPIRISPPAHSIRINFPINCFRSRSIQVSIKRCLKISVQKYEYARMKNFAYCNLICLTVKSEDHLHFFKTPFLTIPQICQETISLISWLGPICTRHKSSIPVGQMFTSTKLTPLIYIT